LTNTKTKENPVDFAVAHCQRSCGKKLDAHFSKESELLRGELNSLIAILEIAKKSLDSYLTLEKEHFYTAINSKYDALVKKMECYF
jgi:hypothetical protein